MTRPDYISVVNDASLSPPPLVVMALNMRTLPNQKTHQNEVIIYRNTILCELYFSLTCEKEVFMYCNYLLEILQNVLNKKKIKLNKNDRLEISYV